MKEIWKDIEGYQGRYQVSNLGRVKSLKMWTGSVYIDKIKILKNIIYKNGYEYIIFDGKHFLIHRLVAKTFIENKNNFPIVNHIDGNKLNNNVNNLEWCTYSHNEKEAYKLKLKKGRNKKIIQYDKKNNKIKEWNSITEAYNQCKINLSGISDCCNMKRKTAGGYVWRFKEE